MAILASVITAQAAGILNDPANLRWTAAELLTYLNLGRRAAAQLRPDMFLKTMTVQLAAGVRQTLPADGHMLMRLNVNMGVDGNTPGAAIVPVERVHLEAVSPLWRTRAAQAAAESYMYDPGNPLEYLVVPANTGTGRVELTYAYSPADIAAGDPIGCADIYQPALLDYVLFRAFSKPTRGGVPEDTARATAHFGAFVGALNPPAAA
jgi:hypothetical protein